MLYSSTITDTADEAPILCIQKTSHAVYTVA